MSEGGSESASVSVRVGSEGMNKRDEVSDR